MPFQKLSVSDVHPSKAKLPTVVKLTDTLKSAKLVHPLNALFGISVKDDDKQLNDLSEVIPLNAASPIVANLELLVKLTVSIALGESWKADSPIDVKVSGNVTPVRTLLL